MNILAIGAHPDDVEYGCAGTLRKAATHGHRVHMLVMTKGSAGGDQGTRAVEQQRAAELIGAAELINQDYQDTQIPVDRSVISFLESTVKRVDPTYIFVHHQNDTHQDHRSLAMATISATRNQRNILFYEGPTTQFFNPSIYSDISAHLDDKLAALGAHYSQVDKTNVLKTNILEMARATAIFRGTQARITHAEAFLPLRLFLDL